MGLHFQPTTPPVRIMRCGGCRSGQFWTTGYDILWYFWQLTCDACGAEIVISHHDLVTMRDRRELEGRTT